MVTWWEMIPNDENRAAWAKDPEKFKDLDNWGRKPSTRKADALKKAEAEKKRKEAAYCKLLDGFLHQTRQLFPIEPRKEPEPPMSWYKYYPYEYIYSPIHYIGTGT